MAAPGTAEAQPAAESRRGEETGGAAFDGLAALPVAEHVVVFEEEHARLQRELSTIDQL